MEHNHCSLKNKKHNSACDTGNGNQLQRRTSKQLVTITNCRAFLRYTGQK